MSALPPSASPFIAHVADFIRREQLLPARARVVAAVSGGADSVALLLVLHELGFPVEVAHCNFHLRGAESTRDERFAAGLAARLHLPFHLAHFDTTAEAARCGESLEMAARRLRYTWFEELRRRVGAEAVCVAHHRDDNAETLLLNLLRGSGLRGLGGIKARAGRIVRPLLCTGRADILRFLSERGQTYVCDSTNTDTRFRRNRIRHEVLPLLATINPSVETTLVETARRLAEATRVYDVGLAALQQRMCVDLTDGLAVDLEALLADPAAATLVYELLSARGFAPGVADDALACARRRHTGAWFEAPQWLCCIHRGRLEIRRRPTPLPPTALEETAAVRLPDGRLLRMHTCPVEALPDDLRDPACAWLDAAAVEGALTVRSTQAGDRFRPYGLRGTKLVNDCLSEAGRSHIDKAGAAVVTDAAGIAWLVGGRIADRLRVTAATRHVVCLRAEA